MVVLDVKLVPSLDEGDSGAEAFGLADDGSGFHAEGFGLIAGGDGAGGIGHDGDDGDGAIAELRAELLLDGGKVGVEVEEEPLNGGRAGDAQRHPSIFAVSLLPRQGNSHSR